VSPVLPTTFEGPGLFDLQMNGYGGFDFNSGHGAWTVADFSRVRTALGRRGVLRALPTLITAPLDRITAAAGRYAAILSEEPELERTFPRLHIEGPFISAEDGPRGAHPRHSCTTPAQHGDFLERLREASGDRIGVITLAPELPGALDLIARASKAGICPSLGHTQASPEVLAEAVAAGARMCTHLGNGSHQVLPRLANYIQAQLADDRLTAGFIADGHHVPWYTLQNFLRAKTPERSVLVTDGVTAADAPAGRYRFGDSYVESTPQRRVQVPGHENLAGSALTLDLAVVNVAVHCGISLREAWAMASTRPAALLGLPACETVSVEVTIDGFSRLDAQPRAVSM
jgi:N-acetylglucosamine-6-phosphate deacetylase